MSNDSDSDENTAASSKLDEVKRHPAFGALKDTTFVPPGVDLTEPADPDWADLNERRWPLRPRER
jgi:hypothetical protein